jgi:hypothetical protein
MDGMKTKEVFETVEEEILPQAHRLTEQAVNCLKKEDQEEALLLMAAAIHEQNIALGKLCAAIKKLLK